MLLALPICLLGQDQQETYLREAVRLHKFDQHKWETLTKDIDYSKDKIEKPEKPSKRQRTTPEFAYLFKYFAIVCGIGLLAFLVLRMATGGELFSPRNRKLKPATSVIDLEAIEENLPEAELQDPLRKAVLAGDYALAVRLHYLAVLKKLSLNKHIKWKREKTNGEYLRELQGSPLFPGIMEATLIFERVWYGKATLNLEAYFALEKKFINTEKAI